MTNLRTTLVGYTSQKLNTYNVPHLVVRRVV